MVHDPRQGVAFLSSVSMTVDWLNMKILCILICCCFGLVLTHDATHSMTYQELPKLNNPRIVIKKAARKLELFDGKKFIKTYPMVLGFTPTGDKEVEGDGKTPEGKFYVFTKNPKSRFHVSLGVSASAPYRHTGAPARRCLRHTLPARRLDGAIRSNNSTTSMALGLRAFASPRTTSPCGPDH